jgi:hypothetical protein
MRILLCVIYFFLISINNYSQDRIIRTDGTKILCKIEKEDSSRIYFSYISYKKNTNTYINKQEVQSVIYKSVSSFSYSPDRISFGLGIGLNYGLTGGNLLYYPQKNVGVFVSGGYQLTKLAFNAGIKFRKIKKTNTATLAPTATIMYGSNTYVWLRYKSDYNTYFNGMTIGLGMDAHFNGNKKGYWSFDVLYPFRDKEAKAYMDEMKDQGMGFRIELLPVTISAAYRFIFD